MPGECPNCPNAPLLQLCSSRGRVAGQQSARGQLLPNTMPTESSPILPTTLTTAYLLPLPYHTIAACLWLAPPACSTNMLNCSWVADDAPAAHPTPLKSVFPPKPPSSSSDCHRPLVLLHHPLLNIANSKPPPQPGIHFPIRLRVTSTFICQS